MRQIELQRCNRNIAVGNRFKVCPVIERMLDGVEAGVSVSVVKDSTMVNG